MANFPDYPINVKSKITPLTKVQIDYTMANSPKGRNLQPKGVYKINIVYAFLERDEKVFLENFWDLYKNDKNIFWCAIDEHTYSVIFTGEPQFSRSAPNLWDCFIEVVGERIT